MAVLKQCKSKGCTDRQCDHPWWLDVQYKKRRYRMRADDFAGPRMEKPQPIRFKEAAKEWEAKFIAGNPRWA